MSSTWGKNLEISIFGESHGAAIGVTINGLPSGMAINLSEIQGYLKRRSAVGNPLATPRKEADTYEIISGFFEGKTTGTPLTAIIKNTNTRSSDYSNYGRVARPGHADYTAQIRYGGHQDYRGGGHFSGRLTAPLVLAGAIAKQAIATCFPTIEIGARIQAIGHIKDETILMDEMDYKGLKYDEAVFPVVNGALVESMRNQIIQAIKNKDSVGGVVEGYATGLPPGLGSPFFESVESILASLVFSIPAVKGLEFGEGFAIAQKSGFNANDVPFIDGGKIKMKTNYNGGLNGGITNGMPLVYRVAFKPTPSIGRRQHTVNFIDKKEEIIEINGRHDPCIVPRACVVVEAVTALTIFECILEARKNGSITCTN